MYSGRDSYWKYWHWRAVVCRLSQLPQSRDCDEAELVCLGREKKSCRVKLDALASCSNPGLQ